VGGCGSAVFNPSQELVPLLVGTPEQFSASTSKIAGGDAWMRTIAQAESWCVLPTLNNRIQEFDFQLDTAVKSDLSVRCRRAFASSASVAHRGAELCAYLGRSGIPAVLFKGLSSIIHLYPGPQERTVKDADLLILEQDLKAAVAALEKLNLHAGHGGDLDAYVHAIRNMPGFAGNESLAVDAPPFEHLDVHWRLCRRPVEGMQMERIIGRAVRGRLFGTEVLVVSPADGLVLSAHHALRNRFATSGMIRDVLDARRWLDLAERCGEWESTLAHVDRCRMGPAVFALAMIGGREPRVAQLMSEQGRELVEWFNLQTREGPLGQDLAHLADFLAMRQVARAALGSWRQYRQYLSDLEKQARGKPLPLGERTETAAHAIADSGPKSLASLSRAAHPGEGEGGVSGCLIVRGWPCVDQTVPYSAPQEACSLGRPEITVRDLASSCLSGCLSKPQ
jgi:hypothetical protein